MKSEVKKVIRVVNFCEILVSVNVKKKEAFAEDLDIEPPFWGSGHVGEDGKLWTSTNDITTNYLEVAMVKAMQHLGIEVKDIIPSPLNREFEVLE